MANAGSCRPTRWAAAWLVAVCLAALLTGSSAGTVSVTSGPLSADRVAASSAGRSTAVADLLARRGAAVRSRDKAAFLATVDPSATQFRRQQDALFDNLAAVPLSDWRYRLDAGTDYLAVGTAFAAYDAPVWVPKVELEYALAGIDAQPAHYEQVLTFVERGSRWYVAADDDLAAAGHRTWRGLWDFGPVVAHRGRSSLVLSHPEHAAAAAGLIDDLDEAVTAVTSVWGTGWVQSVGVVIPGSQQEMAALVGDQVALDRIAAVATVASLEPMSGQRVVINPDNLDALGPQVRRVVIRHEVAHVAARGTTTGDTPAWLVEGFADYLGYLDSGIPIRSAAADLAAVVQRGDVPGELPDAASFDGDSPDLARAYQGAWLGCLLVAARVGPAGLLALYRAASAGPAAQEAAFRNVFGSTYRQFVEDWRTYLVEQLG